MQSEIVVAKKNGSQLTEYTHDATSCWTSVSPASGTTIIIGASAGASGREASTIDASAAASRGPPPSLDGLDDSCVERSSGPSAAALPAASPEASAPEPSAAAASTT